jgi:formate/nitrite transporter FocA (FNT family)
MGGRSATDKILALVFPSAAFVTMSFEHSMANRFFLPYAIALEGFGDTRFLGRALRNLFVVTVGNIFGGTGLVAGVYWVAHLRPNTVTRQTS